MALNEAALKLRARWGYELGRAGRAMLRGLAVMAMFAVAQLVLHAAPHRSGSGATLWIAAAALLALALGLSYRGGAAGRAVPFALLAGMVPLALPIAVRALGHLCDSAACMAFCIPACTVGGGLAGGMLALASRAEPDADRHAFLAAALLLSALAGAMGCCSAGTTGIALMLLAEALFSAPAWGLTR